MDPLLAIILRAAVALLFLSVAAHKLRDLASFRAALAEYDLLPASFSSIAAPVFAVLELVAAIALVAPAPQGAPVGGAILAAALLSVYTIAIAINLARGKRDIDCGCGGPAMRQTLGGGLLVRNAVLMCAALLCLVPVRERPLVWIDAITAVAALAAIAAIYSAAQRLMATGPALARLRVET